MTSKRKYGTFGLSRKLKEMKHIKEAWRFTKFVDNFISNHANGHKIPSEVFVSSYSKETGIPEGKVQEIKDRCVHNEYLVSYQNAEYMSEGSFTTIGSIECLKIGPRAQDLICYIWFIPIGLWRENIYWMTTFTTLFLGLGGGALITFLVGLAWRFFVS